MRLWLLVLPCLLRCAAVAGRGWRMPTGNTGDDAGVKLHSFETVTVKLSKLRSILNNTSHRPIIKAKVQHGSTRTEGLRAPKYKTERHRSGLSCLWQSGFRTARFKLHDYFNFKLLLSLHHYNCYYESIMS